MATITSGDIYLGSSFTVGSNTRNTFSITEQNFIQSAGPSPQNTNLIFYNNNSQFFTPRWNLANSSINISTVPGQISSIETRLKGVNATHLQEFLNTADEYFWIQSSLHINPSISSQRIPSGIEGDPPAGLDFRLGSTHFDENETYDSSTGLSNDDPKDPLLRDLTLDTTPSSVDGDFVARRLTDWDGYLDGTDTYWLELEIRSTHGSTIVFGLEEIELVINSTTGIAADQSISSGDIDLSMNINTEAGDSWVAGHTTTSRTTDYKRPLYLRDEDFGRLYASNAGAITDFYGVSGSSALCKSDTTATIGATSDNNFQLTQYSTAFNFTEVDDNAVITGCDVQITARTPNDSSGGFIKVGFDHRGDSYQRTLTFINLTDQFQTYNISLPFYHFGEQFMADGLPYSITAGDTTVTASNNYFDTDIVGKTIILEGAGPSGADLVSRVDSQTNNNEIEIADAASTTVDHTDGTPHKKMTVYGDSGALGKQPRIVFQIKGLDLFGTTSYEISEFKVRLTYTGKTLLTTGFLRQDLDQLIPNSDDYEFRHLHSITELGRSPYTYKSTSAGGTTTTFPSPWSIGLKNDSGPLTNFTADFTEPNFVRQGEGIESDEGRVATSSEGAREGRFFYPQQQTNIKMLQLIGSVGNWHNRQATTLTMDDVRSAGFRVRHFDTGGDVSSYTHLAPLLNVGYLPKLTGEADLSVDVSKTTTLTQNHNNTADEIDNFALDLSTTALGGFLLDDGASALNTAFDLQNTGLAGRVFAGESDLDFAFNTTFSALLATTAESDTAFDTTLTVTANNSIVPINIPTYSSQIDLENTGLAGRIRSGFTIDPQSAFQVDDIPGNQAILLQQPNTSQVFTTTGYTRTLLIPIQGENRSHERHIYIDQQTRVLKIPIQGEDRAHERVIYVEQRSSREIKAEQLEE